MPYTIAMAHFWVCLIKTGSSDHVATWRTMLAAPPVTAPNEQRACHQRS